MSRFPTFGAAEREVGVARAVWLEVLVVLCSRVEIWADEF